MLKLLITLDTPAENLALDEALLDWAEITDYAGTILRIWEPSKPFVVLGRSSRIATEVHEEACQAKGVPVLRRSSGGATILAGPGCLMYAVVQSYETWPHLRALDQAHQFVLARHVEALQAFAPDVAIDGTSDLCFGVNRNKCSGNSLRCKRTHLLYHGTLLYDFDIAGIEPFLKRAPKEPAYREGRSHQQFLQNLPADHKAITNALLGIWQTEEAMLDWPEEETQALVETRYGTEAWTRCFE